MTYIYRGVEHNNSVKRTPAKSFSGIYRGFPTKSEKTKVRSKTASGVYRGVSWTS